VVQALCGKDVDIITSSTVLARQNVLDMRAFYNIFGLEVGTNCDENDMAAKKHIYKSCNVIYGDVSSFQRDSLLTEFFDEGLTMGRETATLIVDEVDSMLLDK